ncbi:MAG: hypothetical protein MN733_03365 [Nitrososphaera sp.]|nr:hypothetical protein [Nitrososphaera sp.]
MSYRASVIKALDRLSTLNGTRNPDEKDNQGAFLGPIYLWSVVADIAKDRISSAWKSLEENGLIPADDALRTQISGEEVITSSPSFALQVKVTNPRSTFDKDMFIECASVKFKIDKHKLVELAATCNKSSKSPLTKKVIEL